MRGWGWILAAIAAVGVITAVAFGAYHAGERHGDGHGDVVRVVSPTDGSTTGVQVIRVDDGRHWGGHWGFFPGFFVLPLLLFFLFFVLFRWGRWGGWRRGPWDSGSFD